MSYPNVADDEWVQPVMKGYRMQCCECGLIHEIDFKVMKHGRGHKVIFRARRRNMKTAHTRLKALRKRAAEWNQ